MTISDLKEDVGRRTLEEFQSEFGQQQVLFVACDVTKDEDLENLFNETEKFFGRAVDILVNNAGINTNLGQQFRQQLVRSGCHFYRVLRLGNARGPS